MKDKFIEKKKNYLGLDWGKTKVGVAFADAETKMAFAYETLKNDKHFLRKLTEIVVDKKVGTIIIGIPDYFDKENERRIKEFGEIVANKLKVKVFFQNEMFSTKIAERNLIEKGTKKIKNFDDAEAARIILESWLM